MILSFDKNEIENSIPERFARVVENHPDKIALEMDSSCLTYRELDSLSNRTGQAILSRLGSDSEPVALFFKQSIESIVAILGILKTGKFYVPLDPSLPKNRLTDILKDTQTKLIVTDQKHLALTPALHESDCQLLTMEEIKTGFFKKKISLSISSDTLAAIFYTSGSTGKPKGVMWNHRCILHNAWANIKTLPVTWLDNHSLFFSCSAAASAPIIFSTLLSGASLYPYDLHKTSMSELIDWLNKQKITILYPPVSLFHQLLNCISGKDNFPELCLAILGGQTVHDTDVELFKKHFSKQCHMVNRLALSEAGGLTFLFLDRETQFFGSKVPVGYAIEDKKIFLIDDSGKKVGPDTIGEIVVHSRYLSPGYWRDPEMTRQKFLPDPDDKDNRIYLTGDMGKMNSDGCLEYYGRKDFQVKIRGYKVETTAIDNALESIDSIREAVVKAYEYKRDNRLIAYVTLDNNLDITVSELRRALTQKLPDYMIPAAFVIMEKLPRTANGKIDRNQLLPPDTSRPKLKNPYVEPRDALEKQLTLLWEKVLGISPIGVQDDFFDLGGDSLSGVYLVSEIERSISKSLPLESLYHFSTVEFMTNTIRISDGTNFPFQEELKSTILQSGEYYRMLTVIAGSIMGAINPGSLMTGANLNGSKRPLFWCANGYGTHPDLSRYLGDEHPLYGLFSGSGVLYPHPSRISITGRKKLPDIFKKLASHYVDEIQAVNPEGPYQIGGNCAGGKVAVEIALQLIQKGKKVERLCLVEAFDSRLFDCSLRMLLLYGRKSHLKAYKPFRWGEPGWKEKFSVIPNVDWLPGPHGVYFLEPCIKITARKLTNFLNGE